MLTLDNPRWLKGQEKRQIRGYIRHYKIEDCSSKGTMAAALDRQMRMTKSIRIAAHEFLPGKKSIRVFFSYPSVATFNRELEFALLTRKWIAETRFHSSLSKKFMHPAYQTIMAMGRDALPLILRELQRAPGHWFYALRFIAQKDVAESAEGFEEARTLWLNWGKKNHFIE